MITPAYRGGPARNLSPIVLLTANLLLGVAACSPDDPTAPNPAAEAVEPSSALALAANSWALKAPYAGAGLTGSAAAMAPNSAGESIVYKFGGTDGEGGTNFGIQAYNVAHNSWSFKSAPVGVFNSNGAAKLGSRIYFSGGSPVVDNPNAYTNRVWAYDYAHDRMIQRANLPLVSGEGVSGVIGSRLYVLPGACSGERYPNPGYCAEERTLAFFRYDPATNSWATLASAPHYHRLGAAGVLNGKLYVAAGFNGFNEAANLDVYDPATNAWTTLARIPTGGAAIGAVVAGRFYVVTSGGTYAYSPATNSWTRRASPAESHDALVKVTLGGAGRLVAVGGVHGPDFNIPNDTELYTP
jgi:N-acetylneuraminic acid mutarotase